MSLPETDSTWIINGTDGPSASFGGINFDGWVSFGFSINELITGDKVNATIPDTITLPASVMANSLNNAFHYRC